MPFVMDLGSSASLGAAGAMAGQADASRYNTSLANQLAQQQQENQMRQQQQAFEQQRAVAEFSLKYQQAQEESRLKNEQLKALQSYRTQGLDFKNNALRGQNQRAADANGVKQANNDAMLQFKYDHDSMTDQHFYDTYGLKKDQLQSNIDYHDAKIQQGDTQMQNLDDWRAAQLQQGADRIKVEREYHANLLRLQQAQEQGRNDRSGQGGLQKTATEQFEADKAERRAQEARLAALRRFDQTKNPENMRQMREIQTWLNAHPLTAPPPATRPAAAPLAAAPLPPAPAAQPVYNSPQLSATRPGDLQVGQKHAGSVITRVGTMPDGKKVYKLANGHLVDANGWGVSP